MAISEYAPLPESLKPDSELFYWLVDTAQRIVTQGAAATTTTPGLVFQAAVVANALGSSVSVDTADAPSQGATYDQNDVQAIADLANELKADVNTLITDINAMNTQINALLTALRNAGLLAT